MGAMRVTPADAFRNLRLLPADGATDGVEDTAMAR
jgi:hypothetical protein